MGWDWAETEVEKEVGAAEATEDEAMAGAETEGSVVGARSAPRCRRRRRCPAQLGVGGKEACKHAQTRIGQPRARCQKTCPGWEKVGK